MPSLGVFGKTNVRRYKILDWAIRKKGLDYLVEIVRKLDDSSYLPQGKLDCLWSKKKVFS